jgi:hypothetical protein
MPMARESLEKQVLTVDKSGSDRYALKVGKDYAFDKLRHNARVLAPFEGAFEVETRVSLPDDARLERATFAIAASPSNRTLVGSVASVRAGDGSTCVVDFGRMVTVGGFEFTDGDHDVSAVSRWTGSTWNSIFGSDNDPGSFDEVATERLKVTVTGGGNIEAAVRDHGAVWLAAQPTSLELVVDGATVWFERQGSAPDLLEKSSDGTDTVAGVTGDVEYAVDRTDALREAFTKARVVDTSREVTVKLRAATPGKLSLVADVSMLLEHTVTFGSSSHSSTIDAPEEGTRTLLLSGPFTPSDRVREVALTLTGAVGPERIEPVDGPPLDLDAELVLGAGRTLLFGVPSSLAALFGELQGVRLLLASERGGEIAGRLLTAVGADGHPGDMVKGAELAPVQVPAQPSGWFTLSLPKPVPLEFEEGSPVAAWLELVPSYGEISCALTTSTAPEAPGSPLLRRLPGGGTKRISSLQSIADPSQTTTLYACLRVVGLPAKGSPRPAVAVSVPGGSGVALADPTGDDLRVVLALGAGVAAQKDQVPLTIRVGAWGSVTADNVVVAYRKGTP